MKISGQLVLHDPAPAVAGPGPCLICSALADATLGELLAPRR